MALPKQPDTPDVTDATRVAPPTTEATIESAELLRGRNSVTIEHRGTRYRLQETRAGKLILTK